MILLPIWHQRAYYSIVWVCLCAKFSFEEWMEEAKDIQEVRKHGDQAFLEQDFETAINCYSQVISMFNPIASYLAFIKCTVSITVCFLSEVH